MMSLGKEKVEVGQGNRCHLKDPCKCSPCSGDNGLTQAVTFETEPVWRERGGGSILRQEREFFLRKV